jgi:predicted RNA binding protein YcfA (HicA-like mRNA interferase family)
VSRLPPVTGAALVRALERAGFAIVRRRGSHVFLKHADGRSTVVPVHRGETLGPGLLLKIAHDVEWSRDELLTLLRIRR